MNAIGEQFKTVRETKGLTLDQVADDTNIAKRYLAAIENEDFSVFPGDPYIVGFLRNYAEYLSIDPQAIIQSFRGIRIQEQPVPFDALLKPRKIPIWPFIAGGALIVAVIASLILFSFSPSADRNSAAALARPAPVKYELNQPQLEKRFYEGDSILIRYQGDQYLLLIRQISDRVAIESPVATMRFMMGEEGSIDLDKDNRPELTAFISDFQKDQPDKGALIRFSASEVLGLASATATEVATDVDTAAAGDALGSVPDRPSIQQSVVFQGKRSPHPFVLNVTFRNYALFRHEIDRKDRVEAYYHKGDQITVTANNAAKIWASNAAAAKVTIEASG
ncbi:MAG: helix-turn-helix domain-containing protein, partial [Spirochaetales bacterium]